MSFSTKYMRFFAYLLLVVLFAGLNSCKKEEETNPDGAYIRFINASPTLATYNLYFDGTKINNSGALPFGGSVGYAIYLNGNHTVKLTTASDPLPLFTKTINLEKNKIHSAYLIEKGDKMDILMLHDDGNISSKTQAVVQFINLSPDAPALDLNIKDGANLAKAKAYKTGSSYALIDAKKYTFEIKDAATGAVKATIADVDFVAGKYYTVIARGLLNPGANDQPFSGQSISN